MKWLGLQVPENTGSIELVGPSRRFSIFPASRPTRKAPRDGLIVGGDISPIIFSRYNADVTGNRRISLLVFLACSPLLEAQEVKFVDLSNVQQRTALRFPAQQPNCAVDTACVGGGMGGVSVADGAPDRRDPLALGVALDRVAPTDITLDAFEAVFRVLNTGLASIEVPVSPHLSDLQPPGESQPFSYLSLALVVDLSTTGPVQALGVGWVELYGSAEHEDTIVTLKPGQWVRVKAKVTLHTWPSQPIEAQLRGDFWLRKNVFKPQNGGGFTERINLYPNRTALSAVVVHFSPKRSVQQETTPLKP
jgi:hypothetical protein